MALTTEEQQVIDRLKQANNVLITVNSNPTVDQLAACIAATIALNKAGKHATAVFSGEVPSTLEFLQPEQTLEKNTDSLRDFIISLDKSKADKLRYKVEDNVVKIFITPYHTAISEKDFEYSQGDFNVDVILALGVRSQQDLDGAITAHGRILHDATVVAINTEAGSELGNITITDGNASSLSELTSRLLQGFDASLLDAQIATALLTGIVAETERFSNEKTSPATMSISSILMAAGANQQLVATKLEPHVDPVVAIEEPVASKEDDNTESDEADARDVPLEKPKEPGTLEIGHDDEVQLPAPEEEPEVGQIRVDEEGQIKPFSSDTDQAPQQLDETKEEPAITKPEQSPKKPNRMILEPPTLQPGEFTANSRPEDEVLSTNDITLTPENNGANEGNDVTLTHDTDVSDTPQPEQELGLQAKLDQSEPKAENSDQKSFNLSEVLASNRAETPDPVDPISSYEAIDSEPEFKLPSDNEPLSDIEKDLNSPHVAQEAAEAEPIANDEPHIELDDARKAVEDAVAAMPLGDQSLEPVESLNAHPIDLGATLPAQPTFEPMPTASAADQPMAMPQPQFTQAQPQQPVEFMPAAAPLAQPVSNPFNQQSPVVDTQIPAAPTTPQTFDATAPPPVPPPMMPTNFGQPR